ncbi:MAG: AMP-binding protein [Treponema sp.]|nr:AMP-binding protein [Treponema sp.]MBO5607498.1 AMP-binding protein [Treponema sp.]
MNLLDRFINIDGNATYEVAKRDYKLKVPGNFNFAYDVVDEYARLCPEKRALVWCNDENEEHFFSFKEISDDSKRTAQFFVKQGIKKGDRVMVFLRRRYEYWWIAVALHRIGAIVVPATTQLLADDIVYRNNAADIKMIVALDDKKIPKQIMEAMNKSPSVEKLVSVSGPREGWIDFHKELESCTPDFPRPEGEAATCNEDPMLMYFTSGTSGYPKMVLHNFLYPLGHIVTAKFWQNVTDDGLHLSVAETSWAKAGWGKIYGQWISGTAIFVYDMLGFTPDLFFKKISHYKVTTFCAPATVYRFLIRQDLSKYDLSNLRYCVTAGEALNAEVYNRFYEKTGLRIFEGFGQSETPVIAGNFPGIEPRPGSMGKAAPGIDLEVVDENGNHCPPHQVGHMVIHLEKGRPVGLLCGYYRNEDQTKKALGGPLYDTGDTAYYDEDGYIWFVGRSDDIIKSSGFRISPFEVESVLQEHPAVLESAVTGVPDEKRGQLVKATIVLNKGYTASEELELEIKTYVKQHLAVYKIPRMVEFVDELPKTSSGKIRRMEIRKKDSSK